MSSNIRLHHSFLSAIQNPEVVALRGGLSTILKNVIDCQLSRINEALITTVLHLLNHPKTRQYVRADVELEVGMYFASTFLHLTCFQLQRDFCSCKVLSLKLHAT